MGLLRELNEMSAPGTTGAGSVAMVPGTLFGGRDTKAKKGQNKGNSNSGIAIRRIPTLTMPHLAEALGISNDESKFNASDVISKLDAAEKKAKNTEDTVTFGMEDESGNIVKVYVRSEQAKDFEHALGAMLGGSDDNSDEQNTAMEIAEVLFELKNKFDIIDVDWGQIPTDEEEEQAVMGDEQQNPEGTEGAEGEMPPEEMAAAEPEADATSALQQVIDLLKAQAEAQKAEAEAKSAEAKAKEAEYTAIAAKAKVKQEEEILDMEAYYKKRADEKKEAKQIAKLAKYKHDLASDAEDTLKGNNDQPMTQNRNAATPEEEEMISPTRLAELIYGQIRGR